MATYNTLKRGSTGADVKKLQQSLIDNGYDLGKTGADGKYGALTEAAVKQYQKDNKLTVDGMAGKQTQGALYTVSKTTTNTANTTNTATGAGTKQNAVLKADEPAAKGTLAQVANAATNAVTGVANKVGEAVAEKEASQTFEADPLPAPAQEAPAAYDPATDAAYQSALSTLLQVQQSAPTYKDSFSTQLQDAYNKIVNREKFSYDVNSDAMYQQMKDQYVAGGKLAMADTMGQAAALNGGYGSSYAQSVGQQAYQGYMQRLNDIVPELYDRALAQYNQEGQDMYNQYAMLGDMADDEYAKYQDSLNRYYTDLQMAKSDVDTAYNRGYGAYRDSVGDYQWQQQYAETIKQNEIANNQWQQSFAENVKQNEIANNQWRESFDYGKQRDEVADSQWRESFDYGKQQDKIANNQWQQSFDYTKEQDKITNDRYDEQIAYERQQAEKAEAHNKVLGFIGTDYKPSDSELSKAGLTREQYDAMTKYATASGSGTALDNVASMSSEDIVNVLEGFKSDNGEFDDAITAFLSDCVATGRMTTDQAKELYKMYGSLAVEDLTVQTPMQTGNTEFYNIVDRPYSSFKLEQVLK